MKALSLIEPWATLIALGLKRFETRSWDTKYRGPLAIHASLTKNQEALDLHYWLKARYGDLLPWWHDYPRGHIIAFTSIVDIHRTEDIAMGKGKLAKSIEQEFGDYTPGRFAWELGPVTTLEVPVKAKGALGLWNWNER